MNKLLFHIIIFLISFSSAAQDDKLYDHKLDKSKWERIRDDIRYEGRKNSAGREWTYEDEKEYRRAQEESRKNGGSWRDSNGAKDMERDSYDRSRPDSPSVEYSGEGLGVLGYVLIGIMVILLIVLAYFMFLNAKTDESKVEVHYDLDDVDPSEIPLSELELMLQECLANGDYRGAVRIYFIFVIKGLSENGWIRWEKEKTNFHYLREMSGKPEFDEFNRSVSFFEIIWYGKREIDAEQFKQIKPGFTSFLNKLGIK